MVESWGDGVVESWSGRAMESWSDGAVEWWSKGFLCSSTVVLVLIIVIDL